MSRLLLCENKNENFIKYLPKYILLSKYVMHHFYTYCQISDRGWVLFENLGRATLLQTCQVLYKLSFLYWRFGFTSFQMKIMSKTTYQINIICFLTTLLMVNVHVFYVMKTISKKIYMYFLLLIVLQTSFTPTARWLRLEQAYYLKIRVNTLDDTNLLVYVNKSGIFCVRCLDSRVFW